jgi:hypothetical protein
MSVLVTIFAALVLGLLTSELQAWLPKLIGFIVRSAVARLPANQQERFQEEWRAHIAECPGQLSQLAHALSFHWAAYVMRHDRFLPQTSRWIPLLIAAYEKVTTLFWLCILVPLVAGAFIAIPFWRGVRGEPILLRRYYVGRGFQVRRISFLNSTVDHSRKLNEYDIGEEMAATLLPTLLRVICGQLSTVGAPLVLYATLDDAKRAAANAQRTAPDVAPSELQFMAPGLIAASDVHHKHCGGGSYYTSLTWSKYRAVLRASRRASRES